MAGGWVSDCCGVLGLPRVWASGRREEVRRSSFRSYAALPPLHLIPATPQRRGGRAAHGANAKHHDLSRRPLAQGGGRAIALNDNGGWMGFGLFWRVGFARVWASGGREEVRRFSFRSYAALPPLHFAPTHPHRRGGRAAHGANANHCDLFRRPLAQGGGRAIAPTRNRGWDGFRVVLACWVCPGWASGREEKVRRSSFRSYALPPLRFAPPRHNVGAGGGAWRKCKTT